MRKNSKSTSGSKSKGLSPLNLFGPPPVLYGEDEAAYDEMLVRVSSALEPRDFIEEIWVHDLVDAAWNIIRLRRIQAAFLGENVWNDVNEKAASLAQADPKLMEGTEKEKEEMKKLLSSDSGLSWEELIEQNPRANEKFQKFCAAAESTLDKDLIQAEIIMRELDTIERIEHFIAVAQRRYDAIIRELDRHRFIQNQCDSIQNAVEAEFKTITPATVPKITNKKVT
jgi:hypothetical protein